MKEHLTIVFSILWATNTLACSLPPRDPNIEDTWYLLQEYRAASVIFRGKVVKTRIIVEKIDNYPIEWQYSNVDVYEEYKGRVPLEVITKAPITCCMCGQELETGKEYLFQAKKESDGAYTFSASFLPSKNADLELEMIKKIKLGQIDPKNEKMSSYIKINLPPQ